MELLASILNTQFAKVCGTSETAQWYADPVDDGIICKKDYHAIIYHLNADNEKKRSDEYYEENKEKINKRNILSNKARRSTGRR